MTAHSPALTDETARYTAEYDGARIEIRAPTFVVEHIAYYLGGSVNIVACESHQGLLLEAVADRCEHEAAMRAILRGPNYEVRLHGDIAGICFPADPLTCTVLNIGDNTIYLIDRKARGGRVKFVCGRFTAGAVLDLARILRGLLTTRRQLLGADRIHAACVARKKLAVAFVGAPGAGKTSTMLAAIQFGWANELISNDKALVSAEEYGVVIAGIPYAIGMGNGALACIPALAARKDGRRINHKTYFWPRDIAESLGCNLGPARPLMHMVQVQIAPDSSECTLTPSDSADLAEVTEFSDKMHPAWLDDALHLNVRDCGVRSALGRIPSWKFRGNPWTSQFPKLLEQLVR